MEPCKKAEVKNARIRLYPNIPRFPKQPEIRIPAPKQEQGFGVYGAFLCTGTMDPNVRLWPHQIVKIRLCRDFASYRAAGPSAGSEPKRKGPVEPPETRKLYGTQ